MAKNRKKYLIFSGAIVVVGTIVALLLLHGPSFIWQPAKIFSSSAKTQNQALKDIKGNLTSSLAQNLAGQLLNNPDFLRNEEDWDTLEKIAQDSDPAQIFPVPTVPDADIVISQDNSETSVNDYINKVYQTFNSRNQKMAEDFDKSDIEMLQEAIDQNDFKPLDKLLKVNDQITQDLKKIPAPNAWIEIHKEQIGLFMLYSNVIKTIQNTENDPLKSMIALERFQQLPNVMDGLAQKLAPMFGIDFNQMENELSTAGQPTP